MFVTKFTAPLLPHFWREVERSQDEGPQGVFSIITVWQISVEGQVEQDMPWILQCQGFVCCAIHEVHVEPWA